MCKSLHHSISMMNYETNQGYNDAYSPSTRSTVASSQGSNSLYTSEDEDFDTSAGNHLMRTKSFRSSKPLAQTTWKKKVKTELCRFWLQGQDC
jgi:hypothetical protein